MSTHLLKKTFLLIGQSRLARELGVSRQAVHLWLRDGLPWRKMEVLAYKIADEYCVHYPISRVILAKKLISESTAHKRTDV